MEVLGLEPASAGVVDVSGFGWGDVLAILADLTFSSMRWSNLELRVDFTRCQFTDCLFEGVWSEGHMWAASNRWERVRFHSTQIRSAVCPLNRFEYCTFEDFKLTGTNAYRTVFRDCTFLDAEITGFRALAGGGDELAWLEDFDQQKTVVFVRCTFARTRFVRSSFRGVAFEGCSFDHVSVEDCDFRGAIGDLAWIPEGSGVGDPFLAFLGEVLSLIERKLGSRSRAYGVFGEYERRYAGGLTRDKDYSACLYEGGLPDRELDAIEGELAGLEAAAGL